MRSLAKIISALAFFGGMTMLHADTPTATPAVAAPSNSEMQAGAATIMANIQDDQKRIIVLREQARKLKDVIKLNCVNDKLVQANAQLNIADSENEQLQSALVKNTDERSTLYSNLTEVGTSLKQLRESAAACIGTPELTKQESGVEVTKPDVPDDPQGDDPFGPGGAFPIEPPGYASAAH